MCASHKRRLDEKPNELLVRQLDGSRALRVLVAEHVRHPLQLHARLDKLIEEHRGAPVAESLDEHLNGRRGEAIAEALQCRAELLHVDVAGTVGIKALKARAPLLNIAHKAAEFLEVDRVRAVDVEQADHKGARLRGELGLVAGRKRLLQLGCVDLARAVLVDGLKPRPHHRICARRRSLRLAIGSAGAGGTGAGLLAVCAVSLRGLLSIALLGAVGLLAISLRRLLAILSLRRLLAVPAVSHKLTLLLLRGLLLVAVVSLLGTVGLLAVRLARRTLLVIRHVPPRVAVTAKTAHTHTQTRVSSPPHVLCVDT
eukprot:Opistho-1_new@101692